MSEKNKKFWLWVTRPEYYLDEDGEDRKCLDPDLCEYSPGNWWTCHKDTKKGDLVLLYRTRPRADIKYLLKAKTDADFLSEKINDESEREKGWFYACDYEPLYKFEKSLSIKELKQNPSIKDWNVLRANFRNKSYNITAEYWEKLNSILMSKNRDYEKVYNKLMDITLNCDTNEIRPEIIDNGVEIKKQYTIEQIEEKFDTNFGIHIKGITLRRSKKGIPYIILFIRPNGPYSDRIEDNVLYYDGEGQKEDQKLTTANKTLLESNKTGRIIYGFKQIETGKWEYIGILEVIACNYVKKDGIMKYEFKLNQCNLSKHDLVSYETEIMKMVQKEPHLKENNNNYVTITKKQRNSVFSKTIKKYYDNTCAVCGKKRFTPTGYPEVEAAHIYPKSKDGSDDPRNGICLCKLHHWAFDNGLFAINDNYRILVPDNLSNDENYEEIYKFKNKSIKLPNNPKINPHILYLKEHRKIHGFDTK